MKKNMQTMTLILAIFAIFSLGCGMLGGNKISNEQLAKDLEAKTINMSVKSGMRLSKDVVQSQCFKILESKFETDSGELTVDLFTNESSNSVFGMGSVVLSYKKEGDKWVVQKATPKDYNVTLNLDEQGSKDVIKKGSQLCANFENKINK